MRMTPHPHEGSLGRLAFASGHGVVASTPTLPLILVGLLPR